MSGISLCKKDPVMDFVRKQFDSNPLRIPSTQIRPLSVILRNKKYVKYVGQFSELVDNINEPETLVAYISALEGKKTLSTKLRLGLNLLESFVPAIVGSPMENLAYNLKSNINNSSSLSFRFLKPERHFIDLIQFSKWLKDSSISWDNLDPFAGENEILIVDAILTANAIGFTINDSNNAQIESVVKNLRLMGISSEIMSKKGDEIVISSSKRLAFAFSAICIQPEKGGSFTIRMVDDVTLKGLMDTNLPLAPNYELFGDGSELIEIDNES